MLRGFAGCQGFQIRARRFLHHLLQWKLSFGGDATAVLVLRRKIRDGTVQVRNFHAHFAPRRAHAYTAAGERLPAFLAHADPQRRRLREQQLPQTIGIFWSAKHREQYAWTIFLHLHSSAEDVECPSLEHAIDNVAEHLRVEVVKVRLENGDRLFTTSAL